MLVSACLLGVSCRYDGADRLCEAVAALAGLYRLIPICPEQLGGLPTPRPPATINRGVGADVLDGEASLFDIDGRDVTGPFLRGAEQTLHIAGTVGAVAAVLKESSPSCGVRETNRRNRAVPGHGVTAERLRREGIPIFNEEEAARGLAELLGSRA